MSKILKIDAFLDGGTIEITTENAEYCIDDRLFSNTKGSIYLGYPENNNENIISNQDKIKSEILEWLKDFETDDIDWKPMIIELIG